MWEFGNWSSKHQFQISEKVPTNGPLLPKYNIFETIFFDSKTLINFRHSLKIWLSQDPWCSHIKKKNLPCAQCVPPWRIGLNEHFLIVKSFKYGWKVNRPVDWWSVVGGLVDKLFVVSGSMVGVFNKINFFREC